MTNNIIQTAFLKGRREIEINDDVVEVHISTFFKNEKFSVALSSLHPEPLINPPYLEFHGHTSNEPLLSLLINKPDHATFNRFVESLKKRLTQPAHTTTESVTATQADGLAANSYEEPPEFGEFGQHRLSNISSRINTARIEEAIQLLEQYVVNEEIKPLLNALRALKDAPENEACFNEMVDAFNALGIMQGAVLTYAPYISTLLSDNPNWGD